MSGPIAVLVGPPGAGKTSVGRALAARLAVPFIDTDELVVERAGKSVADIFVEDGESVFRQMEAQAVADAVGHEGAVVALGGGAITNAGTRELLKTKPVVLLEVDPATAAKRVGMNGARPLLLGDARARLVTLMRERAPWYAEVASISVPTTDCSVEDVVAQIQAWCAHE